MRIEHEEIISKLDKICELLQALQTPVKQTVTYKYNKKGEISKIIKDREEIK